MTDPLATWKLTASSAVNDPSRFVSEVTSIKRGGLSQRECHGGRSSLREPREETVVTEPQNQGATENHGAAARKGTLAARLPLEWTLELFRARAR